MKTEDLIRGLAADHTSRLPSLWQLLVCALVVGTACAVVLFAWRVDVRPDMAEAAARDPRLLLKFVVTLALAISAGGLLMRLIRPGAARGIWLPALLASPAALALGVAYELVMIDPSAWRERLIGRHSLICLESIPLLAAPILGALLLAMRRGAPTRPALAGAVAGLVAGAIGGAIYATHCPDDSPLFVLTWYGLAIAVVTLAGALIGARVLRW